MVEEGRIRLVEGWTVNMGDLNGEIQSETYFATCQAPEWIQE